MVKRKPRVGVILTNEARDILKGDPVHFFMIDDRYFNCDSVQQDGYFLLMKITAKVENRSFSVEVSIPSQFVLYMLSGEANTVLGFK